MSYVCQQVPAQKYLYEHTYTHIYTHTLKKGSFAKTRTENTSYHYLFSMFFVRRTWTFPPGASHLHSVMPQWWQLPWRCSLGHGLEGNLGESSFCFRCRWCHIYIILYIFYYIFDSTKYNSRECEHVYIYVYFHIHILVYTFVWIMWWYEITYKTLKMIICNQNSFSRD